MVIIKCISALLSIMAVFSPLWSLQGGVPGSNCGISKPFRFIEKGKKYLGPFMPCMLIDDQSTLTQYQKTLPYWDEYQPWSECTKTCGGGTKSRTRSCFVDNKLVDPLECVGPTQQTWNCNKDLCTIPQPWSQWSDCSVTCGDGVQSRVRTCLDTVANVIVPYKHCKNSDEVSTKICVNDVPCNGWTTWSEWSLCPYGVTGVQRNKTRKCMNGDSGQVDPSSCQGTAADALQVETCPPLKSCPSDHPHAFADGLSCCKVFYRSNISSVCDGNFLQLSDPLECCPDNENIDCANEPGHCQDNAIASTFCPPNPGATRSGNNGLISTPGLHSLASASSYCGDDLNGELLKSLDVTLLEAFRGTISTFPFNSWIGLEKTLPATCSGVACINKSQVVWQDGSRITAIPSDVAINLAATSTCAKLTITNTNPQFTITTEPCANTLKGVCQISCRLTAPKYCPSDHPFVANDGKSCCSDFNKKLDLDTDPKCDGNVLSFSDPGICCFDSVPCTDQVNGCQNSENARTFCPANPNLRRSGNMAIRWDNETLMYFYEAQEYCANAYNSALPSMKSPFDIEYIQHFVGTRRFFVNARFPPGISCSGDTCYSLSSNVSWADGLPFEKILPNKIDIWAYSHVLTLNLPSLKNDIQYWGVQKREKFKVNCQFPCSLATPNCPAGYPLATGLGGAKCSRNPWKLNDTSVHPTCDGSKLKMDDPIECCQDCIDCPGSFTKCQNSPASEWFCFGHPNASRYGPTGFIYLPSQGKLNRTEAGKACHAAGGRLPILNSDAKFRGLENFLYSRGVLVTVWIGLESSFAESCSNEACINSTILEWSDGSRVANTGPTQLTIGVERCVRFDQASLVMTSVACSNKYDVACEVDCDQQTVPCPMDHPFPISNGRFCCNDYNKKFDAATNDLCDGAAFTNEDPKECCSDPIPCPKDHCTLNTLNKEFCPRYPESTRYGHATFRMIGAFSWNNAVTQCQSQFNASILSLDHSQVVSYLLDQWQLAGVPVWTNFRSEAGRQDLCVLSQCFDKERRFVWGNGRPFIRFPRFDFYVDVLGEWPLFVTSITKFMDQGVTTSAYQSVCQLECSISPALCPSDYPFATARGHQCSKYYERKDLGGVPCDGGLLEKTDPIECCIACVPCPVDDRPCIDAVKAQEYCPTNPTAIRSSNNVGFIKANRTAGFISWLQAQQYCADKYQAHLPFVKNMQDKIILTRFYVAHTRFWLGGIATYEAFGATACQPPNECSWLDGSSVDLSLYNNLFDVIVGYKTLSFRTNYFVNHVYIVKQSHIPTELVCQTSCSFYQDRQACPTTHPFAFDNGQKCCAHFTQTTSNGCAGDLLDFGDPPECCSISSTCSDSVRGCKTHPSQALLCPPFTEALRMGKKAYETISAPLQTYDEAKATCEAKGGFLPIVKTMKDFENHVFARWLKGVLNDRYWTSLKQSNNPQACSNAACNAQDIQWADGSQFVYEDLNKPITGRTTSTCFAINSNMLIPSLGGLVGFDCTAKLSVICEYSCT